MKIRIYISFLALAALIACSSPNSEISPTNKASHATAVNAVVITRPVEKTTLPKPIINAISSNEVFSQLELVEANEVTQNQDTVYDLTFEDEENFIIRAKFSSEGKLIPYYNNIPTEMALP
ncbi:hypothetical protein GCM10007049_36150 [Echinicola pacifica]|uniref:Beta-lactamase-inhibitor-like, PepSY-like n=1 Tax=Echinicola pacifica TaxID=346377 RepID=A0A918QCU7_9BACT|nr:hypothetical protein [Echinicola pacifica]GGZ39593.1 hypothetical protein GCM10007049_36150 [Echinicola pacifica]